MRTRHSKVVISLGFGVVILLLVALIAVSAGRLSAFEEHHRQSLSEKSAKIELLQSLRAIVRQRSLSMFAISLLQDPFERDAEFLAFNGQAAEFIRLRLRLEEMGLSPDEEALWEEAKGLIRLTAPLQEQIVDKMLDNALSEIDVLMAKDLPLEKELLAAFDELIALQRTQVARAATAANEAYRQTYFTIVLLGLAATLLSLWVMRFVVKRSESIEQALHNEKELAEVTLHAIGDAVISLDAQGNVAALNPVAEQLTGWPQNEAKGRPLPEVYRTLNDRTRRAVRHPAYDANIEGPVVGLSRYSVLVNRHGQEYTVEDNASPIYNRQGALVGKVVTFRDVTHARGIEQQLSDQARLDALTGLANRRAFELAVREALAATQRTDKLHALLYLDLDQFKIVNDTCGHAAGDELLKQLAAVMHVQVRKSDIIARLGGDEFGILIHDCGLARAEAIAEEIRSTVEMFRFEWRGHVFRVGASIGVVGLTAQITDVAAALSAADAACYLAKETGRNRVRLHRPDDRQIQERREDFRWVTRLQDALAQGRFMLYEQWVHPLRAVPGALVYRELLLRLVDDKGEIVPPLSFIPAAERYGLMKDIDRWVLVHALANIHRAGPGNWKYALNVSAQSFTDEKYFRFALDEIERREPLARSLCIEITETAAISNLKKAADLVRDFRALGCSVALDDYGSGMSNFHYLKQLPVDYLKIDGTLVRNLCQDGIDLAMVETINRIAHDLGMQTIAEYVDSPQVLAKLGELGVDYVQGHYLHVPEPFPGKPSLKVTGSALGA